MCIDWASLLITCVDLYSEISFCGDVFGISSMVHPSTYLNKILLGSSQGSLQLWNIRTGYV